MSVIRVDNFGPSAGGTTYSARGIAKAWANLNGTGTIALRDSENVSSVTDVGAGIYDFVFTSAMADVNYGSSCGASVNGDRTLADLRTDALYTASGFSLITSVGGVVTDANIAAFSSHGDLA